MGLRTRLSSTKRKIHRQWRNMHTNMAICLPRILGTWPFRGEAGRSGDRWYHPDPPSGCRRGGEREIQTRMEKKGLLWFELLTSQFTCKLLHTMYRKNVLSCIMRPKNSGGACELPRVASCDQRALEEPVNCQELHHATKELWRSL